ncbi:MAG: A/G-specific adenine glycosylase [Flavisolibacter sp.]
MAYDPQQGLKFVTALGQWNQRENKREMPWKNEKDPYKIWLSEIILQQTRVQQGLQYYLQFIATFPDISALARAPEDSVFKLWEGLGYYSRCRNLITTARYIDQQLNGVFPKDYLALLQLKGVGAYTAAAISSFAFNLPYAVLDGNVYRVLSRIFNIATPIDTGRGKKEFATISQKILPQKKGADYNQAIMDFGALICAPNPLCASCFFSTECFAYLSGNQLNLPLKEKKVKIKERWLTYAVVVYKEELLIQQRRSKDIWQGLYEFIGIESNEPIAIDDLIQKLVSQYDLGAHELGSRTYKKQKLTHQLIHFNFIEFKLQKKKEVKNFFWVPFQAIGQYAFPTSLREIVRLMVNQSPTI